MATFDCADEQLRIARHMERSSDERMAIMRRSEQRLIQAQRLREEEQNLRMLQSLFGGGGPTIRIIDAAVNSSAPSTTNSRRYNTRSSSAAA
jgi:hypothetical protein